MAELLRIAVGITVPVVCYSLYQSVLNNPQRWRKVSPWAEKLPSIAKKIAHRGSRNEGMPENTIAAFKRALEVGADVIECDVWLTADKQIAVFHDESLLRMTGVDRKLTDCTYKELPKIIAAGVEGCSQEDLENIPRLDDVLDLLTPGRALIIEFKQDNWELIEAVHKLLIAKGKLESVFWFSLHESINKKLRQQDRSIPTITSIQGMVMVLFLYYIGILPWVDLDDAVFGITVEELPLTRIRNEKAMKHVPDWIKRLLAWIFQGRPPHVMVVPKLFRHLRRRGIPVWFLGVNDEKDFDFAVEHGASGVLTDRIGWLCELKAKNPDAQFKKLFE